MNKIVMLLCVVGLSSGLALAEEQGKGQAPHHKPPTKEQREKMAQLHEKMAACLRTDKPVHECHEEMMKACQEQMGQDGCPMMNGKGMHHGPGDHQAKKSE